MLAAADPALCQLRRAPEAAFGMRPYPPTIPL